jgi:hypothetical protein
MARGKVRHLIAAGISAKGQALLERHGLVIIPQSEIVEERAKYQEVVRAIERWAVKRNAIANKLRSGALVEEGPYRAELVDKECHSEFFGFAYTMEKLVIS